MQTLTLNARAGWRWLAGGFFVFRRNPPLLTTVVIAYWLLLALLNAVPVVGGIVATVLMPALSVVLMNACRDLDHGRKLSSTSLLAPFRANAGKLYRLGGIYLLATLAILGCTALVDGGALLNAMFTGQAPDDGQVSNGQLLLAAQVGLLLLVPLVMAYWYAPLLVSWHDYPVGKALFFSFFASLHNWRAFLAYSLAVALWSAGVPGLLLGLVAAFSPGLLSVTATALSLPLIFVLGPTLIASFYVSYREVFVIRAPHVDELII